MHLSHTLLLLLASYASAKVVKHGKTCTVTPVRSSGKGAVSSQDDAAAFFTRAPVDDTPQILEAFDRCGKDGIIIFKEGTYNIRQVMNTTDLRNCDISIYGKFLWSGDNLDYWIANTISVDYDHMHTAWLLGGTNIALRGHGKGLLDGNGQVWIDENKSGSNRPGRPISLTIWKSKNILVDGLTWRQSQFWHTFVAYSQDVTMTNLDMKTTTNSKWSAVNTDGFDSWNSKNVYLRNWVVECADDCISIKGNSTNIDIKNITCIRGNGACIGSVGKVATQLDYVDNVHFQDIKLVGSENAAYIKTYSGIGHVRNVTFRNFQLEEVGQPIYVTPCTYGFKNCDTSSIGISDITWDNFKGTSKYNVTAGMSCSKSSPCKDFHFKSINIHRASGGNSKVLCSNIDNQSSMGLKCTGTCPYNWGQHVTKDV